MADTTGFTNLVAGDIVSSMSEAFIISFTAEASISKGDPVYLTSNNKVSPATAEQSCIGIALHDADPDDPVAVCVSDGIVKVIAGEAISVGSKVKAADTSKRVLTWVSGTDSPDLILGTALTAAEAADDLILILVGR
ncbi:DUF2190 family protein [Candidatus Bathyarchaeota archaeon]|nr:MAG: DUF2190 family protein [Candidatus Bathyarchaeota archaeon]